MRRRKKKKSAVSWNEDLSIKKRITKIVSLLNMDWVDVKKITAFRSVGSTTRAYARIWGLSKVWQLALQIHPHYIIEVISEKFDRLDIHAQNEVLIHELMHIPKNFSGALMPHIRRRGKRNFHDKVRMYVNKLRHI